jgi:Tfp pilus assembly protein PilZ
MKDRSAVRVVPQEPISAVIRTQDLLVVAVGEVANISETGICVWTDAGFQVGQQLILRLGFASEKQPFQVAGQVVWAGDRSREESVRRYGLQWAATSGPAHTHLKSLIGRSETSH